MQGLPASPQYVLTYFDDSLSRNSDRVGSKKGKTDVSDRLEPLLASLKIVLDKIDIIPSFKGISMRASTKDDKVVEQYGVQHLLASSKIEI